jgi:hypothetical protein
MPRKTDRDRDSARGKSDKQPTKQPRRTTRADTDANPPRTTTDGITAPKFGSAGSGGLELEPGLDVD